MGTYLPGGAMGLFKIPSQSAVSQWGWGLHTVRVGFAPGDYRFRPQVVVDIDVWRDF